MPLSESATLETALLCIEVLSAFSRKMALTLSYILLRRTIVGRGPRLGPDVD